MGLFTRAPKPTTGFTLNGQFLSGVDPNDVGYGDYKVVYRCVNKHFTDGKPEVCAKCGSSQIKQIVARKVYENDYIVGCDELLGWEVCENQEAVKE
jgi:hypothetical protein